MEDSRTIYVIKRNGEKEPLNINNIRKQTESACEGLNGVSYEELEMKTQLMFQDGITTEFIQRSLIDTALLLNGLERPNYIYVAGRLELYNLYHDIKSLYGVKGRGCVYSKVSIKDYINKFGHTLSDFYKSYTEEEIDYLNTKIDPTKDKLFAYPAVRLLLTHYLNSTSEVNANGTLDKSKRYIIELPQHMFMTLAMFNCQHEDKSKRLELVEEMYYYMSNQYIIPATPQLANGRIKGGALASCLVTSIDDSLESMASREGAIMFGSSLGAGWGVDISRIRALGGPLRGVANRSNGTIPLCKVLDSIAIHINQGGRQ